MTYVQRLSLFNAMIGMHIISFVNDPASIFTFIGAAITVVGWLGIIIPSRQDRA